MFLICTVLLVACATSPTGRRQLMIVSEDSAIAASKQAYAEMLKSYEQEGKIDNDPALKDRVYRITGRLIAQAIKGDQGASGNQGLGLEHQDYR
jgi:hypothetical protein